MLQHAELITANDSCKDTVALGTPVTFMELPDGEHETYTIVGIAEADPLNGTISTESPLAKSLLGRSVGDQIVVKTNVEDMTIQVLSIG
jgi:transcription elongation factor GreA